MAKCAACTNENDTGGPHCKTCRWRINSGLSPFEQILALMPKASPIVAPAPQEDEGNCK